jgi:hypothetical protein
MEMVCYNNMVMLECRFCIPSSTPRSIFAICIFRLQVQGIFLRSLVDLHRRHQTAKGNSGADSAAIDIETSSLNALPLLVGDLDEFIRQIFLRLLQETEERDRLIFLQALSAIFDHPQCFLHITQPFQAIPYIVKVLRRTADVAIRNECALILCRSLDGEQRMAGATRNIGLTPQQQHVLGGLVVQNSLMLIECGGVSVLVDLLVCSHSMDFKVATSQDGPAMSVEEIAAQSNNVAMLEDDPTSGDKKKFKFWRCLVGGKESLLCSNEIKDMYAQGKMDDR